MVGSRRRRCATVLGKGLLTIHSVLWLLSILLLWRIRIQILLDSLNLMLMDEILVEVSVGIVVAVAVFDIDNRATR